MKRILSALLLPFLFACQLHAQSPVDIYGKLRLNGLQLSSDCGNPVQLRGFSSHGPQWTSSCINKEAMLDSLRTDWKANVYRIAMYVEEGGYLKDTAYYRRYIDNLVDKVGARGLYCIIDWHILHDNNPMKNLEHAKLFWEYMSKKHAYKKHVLYEICNEPNGSAVTWDTIKAYAEIILPIIRKNDSSTVVIVGTPSYSGSPWSVVGKELKGALAKNVMYAFHFYAGTHAGYLARFKTTLGQIPVFTSEWGTVESSGKGAVNEVVTKQFMEVMNGDNPGGVIVSWCNWSFADVNEGASALLPLSCSRGRWNQASASGAFVRTLLRNQSKPVVCSDSAHIFQSPRSVITKIDRSVQFKVSATGLNVHFQWLKSSDSVNWEPITGHDSSAYVISKVTKSDVGYYQVKVFNMLDTLLSHAASLKLIPNGPYLGHAIPVPGKVEIEFFDEASHNDSTYFDTTPDNIPGALRDNEVDVETCGDSLGGYDVAYIEPGEYLTYSIDVKATGMYDFHFRVASAFTTGSEATVEVDNVSVIESVLFPGTGNWQKYTTVGTPSISLTAGLHTLKVKFLQGGFNFNYIEILPYDPNGLVSDQIARAFSLYPNPASEEITLSNSKVDLNGAKVQVLTALGEKAMETIATSGTVSLQIGNLKSGVYFIQVPVSGQNLYLKWVKH